MFKVQELLAGKWMTVTTFNEADEIADRAFPTVADAKEHALRRKHYARNRVRVLDHKGRVTLCDAQIAE